MIFYEDSNGNAPDCKLANSLPKLANFNAPTDLAVDGKGSIFITDQNTRVIRLLSNSQVTTFAGTPVNVVGKAKDGIGKAAQFNRPTGIAFITGLVSEMRGAWNALRAVRNKKHPQRGRTSGRKLEGINFTHFRRKIYALSRSHHELLSLDTW
mgnify:CR=1 FL=1